jgi:hypothetical protein
VAYLPFLIVIGVADRFLYLVAAAYAVLVVFSMSYLHRFGKAYQALCAGIFLVLLVSHSFTTASRVAEWQEAGAIVYNTSKEFYRLFPDATHSDRFVFHQLPSHHGKAILFLTNVEKSMAWWHEEFKGQIYQSTDKFDPVKTKDEARHLVYNEGIGNIQLVH